VILLYIYRMSNKRGIQGTKLLVTMEILNEGQVLEFDWLTICKLVT
jgi:hypothetical protein